MNDSDFFNLRKVIAQTKESEGSVYKLNDVQRARIRRSKEQIKRRTRFDNEKVFKEIDSWLKEK